MTPEQLADREGVWAQIAIEHPEFKRSMDPTENYHTVREIVLGGSPTWKIANTRFKPEPGTRVMDIGANIGIYTAFAAANGAEVVAYEASPMIFRIMSEMVEANGLNDLVTPVKAAVSTYTGHTRFLDHRNECEDGIRYNGGMLSDGVVWAGPEDAAAFYVDCISFEHAIGSEEWDFVKFDVEGAENEILLATDPHVFERICFMFIEFHPWASRGLYVETVEKLKRYGNFEGFYWNERDDPEGRWDSCIWTRNLQKLR